MSTEVLRELQALRRTAPALLGVVLASMAGAAAARDELPPPGLLAQAFGASANFGAELSPDGTLLSLLRADEHGATFLEIIDLARGSSRVVLESPENRQGLRWCRWANETRLICAAEPLLQPLGPGNTMSLIAIDADGENLEILYRNVSGPGRTFDRIIDWLPDDPGHLLLEIATPPDIGVVRVDIHSGEMEPVDTGATRGERPLIWITDNHGALRVRLDGDGQGRRFLARATPEAEWELLRDVALDETEGRWSTLGFGESRDELLFLARNGDRRSLFAVDLAHGRTQRLVHRDARGDVEGVHTLGKYNRAAAALVRDNRAHLIAFDARTLQAQAAAARLLADREIMVVSESWDGRYHLLLVRDEHSAGTYYRFDSGATEPAHALREIGPVFPRLAEQPLAAAQSLRIRDAAGNETPAYLTLPANASGPAPAVVLAIGGPQPLEKGYWHIDHLAQYLTARGFAVLQIYRGTGLFEWGDEGGFRAWPDAVAHVAAGADRLVADGVADPGRICVAGYHYAGHTALMSVIEHPELFRCVVSVSGISDPSALAAYWPSSATWNARATRLLIGTDDLVRVRGSPFRRAEEIKVPVLLVHAGIDDESPLPLVRAFAKRLERGDKDVRLVAYPDATGDFRPRRHRIDMLERVGEFLGTQLGQ